MHVQGCSIPIPKPSWKIANRISRQSPKTQDKLLEECVLPEAEGLSSPHVSVQMFCTDTQKKANCCFISFWLHQPIIINRVIGALPQFRVSIAIVGLKVSLF